jgi:chromosome segregation ATPase
VLERVEKASTKATGVFELDLDGVEALCARAEKLIEATGAGSKKPADGTLAAVAAEAMRAMERMDEVASAGERARRQAEESRKALGESIESAALWLDRLVEQRDGLQQSIALATKLCEQAEGQLSKRHAELDEAMRAPATEVQRHLEALKAASERAEARRDELAQVIEQAEKRAETKANAAADKAAERAIHKAKIETEKLDAKAIQARQALEQAWKTLETRLKGELKESLTALSAEGARAERIRVSLREDIEAARQVEKETRAAISKPASPSSVDQLNKLATLMQDLAERTAAKPGPRKTEPQAASTIEPTAKPEPTAPPPASKKEAAKPARTTTAKVAKKTAKKAATKKKAGG